MAVDPNTGQTILNLPGFDQKYAAFIDPSQIGELSAQQGQNGQMGALGRSLLQAGYIPNSGFAGALAQMAQALIGSKMLKNSQDQMGDINTRLAQAAQDAAKKAHDQGEADKDAEVKREIAKAAGIDEAKVMTALKHAQEQSTADAHAAAEKANALLPSEAQKIQLETQGKIQAATAAAEVANRRGYVVPDASGNSSVITPQGKVIYQATTPGGGKLTPSDTALNQADVNSLEKLNVRKTAAAQLQQNLINWTAQYTNAKPEDLQGLTPAQLADKVKQVSATHVAGLAIDPRNAGLDAIASDIAINAAGTKRDTPTDDVIKAERNNTVSRFKLPSANATIIANHAHDIQQLQDQLEQAQKRIQGRTTPGQGRIPAAEPGPMNQPAQQTAQPHYIYDPKSGQLVPAQ